MQAHLIRSVTLVALFCVPLALPNLTAAQTVESAERLAIPKAGSEPREHSEVPQSTATSDESTQSMPPAAALASIPGFGIGHLAAGQRRTGLRLLAIQGVGLGSLVLGGLGLVLSGASRRLIYPSAVLALAGGGSFLFSWFSDIVGTLSRGKIRGTSLTRPFAELAIGGLWIADPQFSYGPFLSVAGSLRYKKWQGTIDAKVALTTSNQRIGVEGSYFLLGETRREDSLRLRVSATVHRFADEGFRTLTIETAMSGRLSLSRIGPSLRGLFVEGELGIGFQGIGYDALGSGFGEDFNTALLFRVAYGVYLGDRAELLLEYDQREDDFAGSISIDGIGVATLGHVGIRGRGYFGNGPWGIEAYAEYGSAWIGGLNLRYRWLPKTKETR